MQVSRVSINEEQTVALGRALGRVLSPGDVVALDGELGAGKTRFVRGVCEGMGLDPAQVSSPTFVFVNEYTHPGSTGVREPVPLRHVDAYRLRGEDGLESIGWDRVADGSGVVIVEWASRLGRLVESSAATTHAGGPPEPSVASVRIDRGTSRGDDFGPVNLSAEAEGRGERILTLDLPDAWALRRGWDALAAAWGAKGRVPAEWVRCPTTARPVPPHWPTFPFIDEKARMADLGKWMTGNYTISREIKPEDVGEEG